MFSLRIGGIEVTCGSAVDAAALIAALGELGATKLLPAAVGPARAPVAPAPRARRAKAVAVAPKKKGARLYGGRPRTWSDEELKALSARLRAGERLDVLAAEKGKRPVGLYAALRRAGLPTKYEAPAGPVVRKLPPGESRMVDDKGYHRRAG